jgi:site-specific DNA recombinase
LQKIESLERKHNLKVIATSEPLDIDTSDPSVFLLRAFKYLIANQELLTIRRRAKVSSRHAQESGRYINAAPYGYLNGRDAGNKNLLIIDETKSYIVQKIFRDFLSGVPRFMILKEVKELGFPQSGNSAIFRILTNPLYAGLVRVCASGKFPEKIIKAIHKPIISASQYWRVQDLLGLNKRAMKSKPKDEFPLKGFLKSPCCGTNMTAGWSKGKNKYYLYYRCITHTNMNISGIILHDKFSELLRNLSFSQAFIDDIVEMVREGLNQMLIVRHKQLNVAKEQLTAVKKKIENTEENLLGGTINGDSYKKWMKKFSGIKVGLIDQINYLQDDLEDYINQELLVLPHTLILSKVFEDSSLSQQHAIINEVFRDGLTFSDGMFITPTINGVFECNQLMHKENKLLFVKQPPDIIFSIKPCGKKEDC